MNKNIEILKGEIEKLENKTFKVYFYVFDSKGTPSGTLSYIYETALRLKKLGYDVTMLHTEKEFVGVGAWMGEEYAALPHVNVNEGRLGSSMSDFLFIPELNSNVMAATKTLLCKRVAILTNYNYLTDVIPVGASWGTLKVGDCIATTESLKKRINEVFPYVRTNVVRPAILDKFKKTDAPKKLIVNVVAKDTADISSIVKPLHWKYPAYSFVAVRPLQNLSKDVLAEALKESCVTIWDDPTTDFGSTALEAMAAGNIVIGKVPENIPDWMLDKDGNIRNNGLWFYNTNDVHTMIAEVLQTSFADMIPESLYKEMEDTVAEYSEANMDKDIQDVYVDGLFEHRRKELIILLDGMTNKNEKSEE